ncbi:TonB-dependent receptor [Novosphingobium sp. G106]|uniref:TonB-dependent receptor n=1 Tax=Novosphingobium sp. G106 TaxID=2849500 RepID=UPI001C2D8C3F|nr:TonB-dependent receptor [Novosphingobium sp. G106]MBV1692592.1 TonB-dependent receptor [Novosphingobium sp. G106]
MRYQRVLATLPLAALAILGGVAHADTGSADAAAADASGLNDIVVTATKRETNLQKTPIAINVVGAADIQKQHVQSLIDFAQGSIPSLRVATFEARQSALTVGIRGIVPFDQNQTARDTGVGVYIDGVYLGRSQGLNAALFDVERIEVLKGPQGTLFGRNTEGGALSIVTKAPTGEFDGRVKAGVGNYGQYAGEAHLDLPEFANIAIKIDGVMQHQGATTRNPLVGQLGWNAYNRVGGRIQALWKPFEGLSLDLSFDKAKDENTPFYSQLVNYNPQGRVVGVYNGAGVLTSPTTGLACSACIAPLSPLVVVSGDNRQKTAEIGVPQQYSVDRTQGFMGTLKYDIAPSIQLRSITAWRKVSTIQYDNSGGAHRTIFAPNTKFSRYSLSYLGQNQFSQEVQLVGSMPQIDWVVGGYYYNEHATERAATPASNQWNANGTAYTILQGDVSGPITSANQGWDPADWFRQRDSSAKAKSYALFGQATFTPAGFEQLHLTAGGRWTKDKREGTLTVVNGLTTNFPFAFSQSRFDPMVTLAWDAAPDINLYIKYATGYRAGGANDRSQTFAAFGPESVRSYEAGAKMQFFDRKVRLNLAGYIMDRKGTQIDFDNVDTNPASPTFNLHTEETRNAPGTTKIRGLEADLTIHPIDQVTLGASYAYTYTRVPATVNPFLSSATTTVLAPVFIVYTPKNAASGFVDVDVPVGGSGTAVRFHLDGAYADPQYSFQSETVKTDSSLVFNGSIALAEIPMGRAGTTATLSVWSRNLFNETHIYRRSAANAAILGDYANFNPPRTFGVEGTINF